MSPVITFRLNTLKGTAKAPAVDLLRLNTLKAAKDEIQKPSTCRATLFRFASFGRCFAFFTLRDQLDPQQKHLLRVEEMQGADWLIC